MHNNYIRIQDRLKWFPKEKLKNELNFNLYYNIIFYFQFNIFYFIFVNLESN